MDIALLTAFLSPFLPFLLTLGEKASEKAGEQFGEDAWRKAKAVWAKLQPRVEAKAAAQEAVTDVASNPEDEDLQASLRVQLKKILEQDQDLATAIAQIMQSNTPSHPSGTQITQTVTGNQNQIIGQMTGGTVMGNVGGPVFTIADSAITNLTGMGNIHYQAAPPTPPTPSNPTQKTILVLAANPKDTNPLGLGEEVRRLQSGLERSQYRDRFHIEQCWAVTVTDLRRALLDCQPQIVHFSGHGVGQGAATSEPSSSRKLVVLSNPATEPEGLILEDETGQTKLVSGAAIARLFGLFSDQIECVVLNACYSATQAQVIAEYIPYVVGMKQAISDKAAIEFAIGFYDAILAGRSIEFAYDLGCSAIQMAGIPEHLTPAIHKKPV